MLVKILVPWRIDNFYDERIVVSARSVDIWLINGVVQRGDFQFIGIVHMFYKNRVDIISNTIICIFSVKCFRYQR